MLLWRRAPARYIVWRNTLLVMLVIGLVIFWAYPLMPPRLMPQRGFVDTAAEFFNFGPQQRVVLVHGVPNAAASRPRSATCSPRCRRSTAGWSMWSALAMLPVLRSRWAKALVLLDPLATLFAIVVTANHWILDAVGGWVVLGMSWLLVAAYERRRVPPEPRRHGSGRAASPLRRRSGRARAPRRRRGPWRRARWRPVSTRRPATRQRSAPGPRTTVGGSPSSPNRHAAPDGADEVEADRSVELGPGLRERVGERPPREPRDVPQPVGRRDRTSSASATSVVWIQHSASRVAASVRALSRPTTHCSRALGSVAASSSRSAAADARHCAPISAPATPARALDRRRGRRVDRVVTGAHERLDRRREVAAQAGERELVGLVEVQHDVGDVPALARRRRGPFRGRQAVEHDQSSACWAPRSSMISCNRFPSGHERVRCERGEAFGVEPYVETAGAVGDVEGRTEPADAADDEVRRAHHAAPLPLLVLGANR